MKSDRTHPRRGAARHRAPCAVLIFSALSIAAAPSRQATAVPPARDAVPAAPEARPLPRVGSGELLWLGPDGPVPLPVVDLRVEIEVTGVMARGRVRQTFVNPTGRVIDTVYVFPLPERAAVDALEMQIGERCIVAVLKEREEARAAYEAARREGRKASLLDQKRANLFRTAVANINPGEEVAVRLEYLEEVDYQDGDFGLAFPLTFTPRYDPAASRPDPAGPAGGAPAVPRAAVDVSIRAGVPLDGVRSPSHAVRATPDGAAWRVELENGPVPADRDLILRWTPRRAIGPSGVVFVEQRDGERYALAMLLPPDHGNGAGSGMPTGTLFIIDVSTSMDGPSIRQARRALLLALDRQRAGDTFNIIKFNDHSEAFKDGFVPASGTALDEARAWVKGLEAEGGTEILPALVHGMSMMADADPWPVRRIILITDGAVSNEEAVFEAVARRLGGARLHIVGIGPAPNRHLARRLARFGRGSCEFIGDLDEVEQRIDALLARIDRPVMTDLGFEWDGGSPPEAYPARLPDLHAGEPLFVSLRLARGATAARALLRGRLAGGPAVLDLAIDPSASVGSGVATRWARARVDSLMDGLHEGADGETVRRDVVDVAKRFNLVTRYTSLVAVDDYPTADPDVTLPQGGGLAPLVLLLALLFSSAGGVMCLILRRGR